jgi:cytochrome c peroxidase
MQRAFKTPSLRNAALTAPYFHDGSEPALVPVVRFYNQGGRANDPGLSMDSGHCAWTTRRYRTSSSSSRR